MPLRDLPKILIVEDDDGIIFLVKNLFLAWGWCPVVAEYLSAAEGLLAGNFDLVLLDLMLPDGNGIDILRKLRERPDAPPVIVSTGNDAPRVMDVVESLRPDAVFKKPLDVDALLAFVDGVKAAFEAKRGAR